MKSSLAAGVLALALVATSRGADASKQVHDAVRDFLDLKHYAWRESRDLGKKIVPIASGRTEVDGFSIGVWNWDVRTDLAFVNLGERTAVRLEAGWKLVADMDADEIKAVFGRQSPRGGAGPAHWTFVPPHDVLVAIVGMAPAPDWIGDKIVGILALDEALGLALLLDSQGRLQWDPPPPPLVRNKLGGISPAPTPPARFPPGVAARLSRPVFRVNRADYELYFRDQLIAKLVLHLETVLLTSDGADAGPPRANTWTFEFSEVGRIDVTPDSEAKALFAPN